MAKRSPKLLFTDEERQAPELKQAVRKADKANKRLEKAEANIPKKRIKKRQRYIDEKSGKVKTKILFEEVDKKKPSSYLKSEVKTVPVQAAAGAAVNVLRDNEDDSSAADVTHSIEKTGRVLALYHTGLNITGAALLARGITQVLAMPLSRGADAAISGIAGIGHLLLGISLVLLLLAIRKKA